MNEMTKLTPMEKQYKEIKSRHLDKILFFRVGDFYEMFFEDAKEASSILKIALTSRNNIPMAGVPYHAANYYIQKLLQNGKKVAICEQTEDPAKAKGIVKREIVNIITPGTVVEENFISSFENNYFCSIFYDDDFSLLFSDISTGEVFLIDGDEKTVIEEINKFLPKEIIANEKSKETSIFKENLLVEVQYYPEWYFEKRFVEFFENIEKPKLKKVFTSFINYLYETQGINDKDFKEKLGNLIKNIEYIKREKFLEMDDFTVRNLELLKNMQDGSKKYTLLDVLDDTITPMGGRYLRNSILMPLCNLKLIQQRLNYVESFFNNGILLSHTREILKNISDIERIASRISLKKVIPKDLKQLSFSISNFNLLKKEISTEMELYELVKDVPDISEVVNLIENAIVDDPPSTFNGEVIKRGFNKELDELRNILSESKDYIIKLQEREKERTKINSLKIKYNQVIGYFIEISKVNLDKVPDYYIRKQSLVGAERFTIPELTDYEMKIATASVRISSLEEEIFNQILEECFKHIKTIHNISKLVALIDFYSTLAKVAKENNYVKPVLTDSLEININNGRHPVVEKYIGRGSFVPNDTNLGDEENRILIITGPNMAGKSTYLRQNALIVIMAQMGSFVPAEVARIGIVDKIFTRIGASDNLSGGQSTFLIEMQEAARILSKSTPKSLIIMDELGRGTSTYDGLSIAWAVIEYIHEHPEKCGKTLFATHYHELTSLADRKGIKNYSVAVREYNDELVFLRKVLPGPSDKSYGIFVAKLAGMPEEVIERAKLILATLEKEGQIAMKNIENIFDKKFRQKSLKKSEQLNLFPDMPYSEAIERIKMADLNKMTPIEALNFLSELKKLVENE
ncbi:MAG: DNA mismatch repair protein MutS [Brevinematales bacterium]|nr:DNA mismatch repair protein MutS [Brevinematales bacterium]